MITRIYQGTNQRVGDGPPTAVPGPDRADIATRDQMGVDVGGGIDPVSPHCSVSYSAEINLGTLAPWR
jgi:hypothetical protein